MATGEVCPDANDAIGVREAWAAAWVIRFPNAREAKPSLKEQTMSYHFQDGGTELPEESLGDRATQVGSTKHFTGRLVIGDDAGRRLGVESHLETKAALLLSTRSDTLSLVEQVRFEWFDADGEIHDHYIDLVVARADGVKIGYAVRPWARVSARYLEELSRIKEQSIAAGALDDFRLFTESDVCPLELHNAKLFHSVRRPDVFADPVVRDVLQNMAGVFTVDAVVEATGLDGMAFRAVARLIRSGHLALVCPERITRKTRIFKALEISHG